MGGAFMDRVGSLAGRWASARWGKDVVSAVEFGKEMGAPLAKAFLDSFVLDRLASALWPAVAALAALVVLGAASAFIPAEALRVSVGAVVLSALAWSALGTWRGGRAAAPHIRFWALTRLRPRAQARLIIYHFILVQRARIEGAAQPTGFAGAALAAALDRIRADLGMTPERAAYALADHVAPIAVRHLLERLALVATPFVAFVAYYRMALYPILVPGGSAAGPWAMSLYPIATLIDVALGTSFRAALIGS